MSRSRNSFWSSERSEHVAIFTTSALAAAAVLALSALAAGCGSEVRSQCPPAPGSALGGPESQSCGCYAQVPANATAEQLRAAIEELRATDPDSCLFKASGASEQLRSAGGALFSIAPEALRPERPDDLPLPQRVHFAVEYE